MEYLVEKYVDGAWWYEGIGPLTYVNKVIEYFTKNGIVLRIGEVKKDEVVGYEGCLKNPDLYVPAEEAFDYVKEHLDELNERDRKEFVEFFFSGDWIRKVGNVRNNTDG